MKRSSPNFYSKRKQGGFSLIELAIVIAIAAIIIMLVFSRLSRVQNARIASDEASNYSMMMTDIRTKYGSQGDFAGITAQSVINNGLAPRSMVNGTALRSGWNTPVTIAPISLTGTANDGVQLTYNVPREQCSDFVVGAAGASARVTVGSTVVKNAPANINNLDVNALGTACNANLGGTVAVLLAQGR